MIDRIPVNAARGGERKRRKTRDSRIKIGKRGERERPKQQH